MVTKGLVEVPFSVHGLIFIESVRGPFGLGYISPLTGWLFHRIGRKIK